MYTYLPKLMEKRLMDKEHDLYQLCLIAAAAIIVFTILVLNGLAIRFKWMTIPYWRYYISGLLTIIGLIILYKVVRVNAYLSPTIKVDKSQILIQSGPYSIVRHPMYTSMSLLFFSAFFSLGCMIALFVALLLVPILILRIKSEERTLITQLDGYYEYTERVKYRLIPFIW